MSKPQIMSVPLRRITRSEQYQVRTKGVDEGRVLDLVELIKDGRGAELPPISLAQIGDDDALYLVDGWHRFDAFDRTKATEIRAAIHACDEREAAVLAVRGNAAHGLPLTMEDKRRQIEILLRYCGKGEIVSAERVWLSKSTNLSAN